MNGRNSTKRTSMGRARQAVARAAAVAVERLEGRALFSGIPTATIAGPASVAEGANYPLTLSTANLLTPVDHWTVNWGDGQSTVAGTATEADHVYPDGPHAYSITATATLTSGIVLTANLVGAGVTSPGIPDPAFAAAGKLVNAQGNVVSTATTVATLDDGQVVIAGSVGSGANNVLQRYNADGSLDTTFGSGGTLVVPNATHIGAVLDEHVADPAHPGYQLERLLVVGSVNLNSGYTCHSTLWRYDLGQSAAGIADGTPDAAFGTAGVVTLPFQLSGTNYEGDNAFAATIAPSGQIVVEGLAWLGGGYERGGEYLAVSRLNPNGTLDTTFNGTGQQAVAVGNSAISYFDVQLSPVGVVAGADGSVVAMADGGSLVKLNTAGQPDPHFGTGGVATESANAYPTVVTYDDMTLDSSGNLLLGGAINSNGNYGWALGRYNYTTGAVDTNYGVADPGNTLNLPGIDARFTSHSAFAGLMSLTTLATGQVVAEGRQTPTYNGTAIDLTVGRFAANGTPDASFAAGGLSVVDLGGNVDSLAGVAVQPDGKLVAAATAASAAGLPAWAVVRFGQTVPGTVTPTAVSVANVPPIVAITTAPAGHVPEGSPVNLAATVTDPSPADTAAGFTTAWTVTRGGQAFATGTGTTLTFTPTDNGAYAVTFTATDKDGGSSSTTTTVTADNVAPTPTIANPVAIGAEGTPISLTGSATDPSSVDTAAGLAPAWSVAKNGAAFATGSGGAFTFTPDDNGSYVVTFTATDKDGGVGTTTDTVAVANVAPTATIIAPVSAGLEGTTIHLSGSATDPSPVDTAAGLGLAWSVTKNGTAFATGSGASLAFTPDDNGTYVASLTATDKDGGASSATDTIAVGNVAPTPTLSVTTVTRVEGSPVTVTGSATDPSPVDTAAGLSLGWAVTKNGSAFAAGTGASFMFTPDDNGSYAVTLTATDKDGGRASTSTTVAIANVAPTPAIANPVSAGAEGTAVSLSGSATDPSPVDTAAGLSLGWSVTKNGNAFATGTGPGFTFTPDDNGSYVVTLKATDKDGGVGTTTDTVAVANVAPTPTIANPIATSPEGSAVTLSGSAVDPSPADTAAGLTLGWAVTKNGAAFATGTGGGFTFTPDDNGTYVVTLSATDKDGGVATTTDPIAVTNVAPTPAIVAPASAGLEGTAITLTGSATDPSPADTAAGLTLGWAVTKNGAAFATGSGPTLSFTPDDNGTYVVTLRATDKDGGVGTTTDTVAVANVVPTPTITAPVTAGLEGTAIALTGSATDPSPADTAAGLSLGWAVAKNGSPFASGSGPSYVFTPDDNGTYVVTLSASDKDGGVGTTTRTIAVANVAPTATIPAPIATGNEGSPITLVGAATDPSPVDTAAGLTKAWAVTKNGSPFATAAGGTLTFTPDDNGTYVATFTATDKDGGVGTATDTVAVANVAPTPTINSPAAQGYAGVAVTLTGSATDPSPADTAAGLTLAWSTAKNGAAFGSAASGGSYAFTPDTAGTYVVTLKSTDKDGGTSTTTDTVNVIPAGYRLAGANLMYNAVTEATNVASYALRNDGNAYYLTNTKAFNLNLFASGQTTSLGQVYSYGLRADGWAYYWSQADNKLYINQSTYNVPVDNNPVLGFGMRSDGYGYYWDGASKVLYLNTTSSNIPVDNNPLSGFGMRSDGSAYFWDSVSRILQVNTVYANYQIGGDPIQGFGTRSDGSAFFWDANNGILYVNLVTGTPTGGNVQVSNGAVSSFASDSNGNGFFAPANAPGTLHRNTIAADTLVTSAYVANSLTSGGPGPVSSVSYNVLLNGVVTRVVGS